MLTDGSFPPVWTELYDDPELIKRFPYLPVLKESILAAQPRPASANYNQLSLVIASAVAKALNPTLRRVRRRRRGLHERPNSKRSSRTQ